MEIREHGANHAELKSRIDEDVRLAGAGADSGYSRRIQSILRGRKLQRSNGCRAHGNYPSLLRQCSIDLCRRGLGYRIALAMQLVLFNILNVHRLECPE